MGDHVSSSSDFDSERSDSGSDGDEDDEEDACENAIGSAEDADEAPGEEGDTSARENARDETVPRLLGDGDMTGFSRVSKVEREKKEKKAQRAATKAARLLDATARQLDAKEKVRAKATAVTAAIAVLLLDAWTLVKAVFANLQAVSK